jgi:sphingosine 1-phosphate receptor 3
VFIACWAPLFILFLIDVACRVKECSILFKDQWFIMLAVLNSAMNPIIYTLASKEMRRAFFRLVCSCLVRSQGAHNSPMQPALDPSRSKSSTSNNSSHSPKIKEDLPRAATSPCITDRNRMLQNGVVCK